MRIRYTGHAPFHRERYYGSGILFKGPQDIQIVDDEAIAKRMVEGHPDVYQEVRAREASPAPAAPPEDDDKPTEERERDADSARIIATYLVVDNDEKVPLAAARYSAIHAHVTGELNMRMRNPSRDDLLDAVVSWKLTQEGLARAEAGEDE